jgi:hypothetical protein
MAIQSCGHVCARIVNVWLRHQAAGGRQPVFWAVVWNFGQFVRLVLLIEA